MAIEVKLVGTGPEGTVQETEVGSRRFLQVAIREGDPPPIGEANRFRYFNQLLDTVGDGTGTTSMVVDGSSTPQVFKVRSSQDFDIRITQIIVFVGDASVTHAQFGGLSALATGFDLAFIDSGVTTNILTKAKTNGEMLIQAGSSLAWGDQATSFELTNYSGTQDAFLLNIPIASVVPNGVRIGRGTEDELRATVNDAMAGLDDFTVRAIGYRHAP